MAEKLRFGIVGCGVIGPVHAEAIASLPDAQLVSVVDINTKQAEKLAGQYGATHYTQLQHMLDSESVDVVIICTPSGLHGELACQVMRSRRPLIVEKPMELTREPLDEMSRVQHATGVTLSGIGQHRLDGASRQVHELAQE